MVMVKPGLPLRYNKIKDNFKIPVMAYQVSGEIVYYLMVLIKKL